MREDPYTAVPPGPICGGEAGLTLPCRAFVITLENASQHTVHLSELACEEPRIIIEREEPRSSNGWWPVSLPEQPGCAKLDWVNVRLTPGERTEYATRLIGPRRHAETLVPGSYTLRATWVLYGCTEAQEGIDCLAPLQVIHPPSSVPEVAAQDPVTVFSNEVTAVSPPLPELGAMRFSFEVAVLPGPPRDATSSSIAAGCSDRQSQIDCTVFRYTIRNLGDRAVRNMTSSCSSSGITPEYRQDVEWKPVPQRLWECFRNVSIETGILPGGTAEGEFTLAGLAPGYDTALLRASGESQIRFTFHPYACFASPDAGFCLDSGSRQEQVLSRILTLRVP
jgi:hypothetical protein